MKDQTKKQIVGFLTGLALGGSGGIAVAPEVKSPPPGTMTWDQQVPWEHNISASSTEK